MADPPGVSYAQRAELIADICGVLKAARRPLTDEWKRFDLDADGWKLLETLTDRLVRHISFEHLERRRLLGALRDAVRRYKDPPSGKRPDNKQFAAEVLDGLARLVADPVPAQEIDVVGAVQEVFHRGRPVSRDTRREAVENAAVNAARAVVRLEQERQRGDQHGRLDPPRAVNGQVAGHFTGPHGEPGQYNPAQVERAEQDMKIAG